MNTQIVAAKGAIDQAYAELDMLVHIDDDAQRDAVVTGRYEDRADAKRTSRDVSRIRKHIQSLSDDRDKLVNKRDRLVARLASE